MASLARLVEALETRRQVDPSIQSEKVSPTSLAPHDQKTQCPQPQYLQNTEKILAQSSKEKGSSSKANTRKEETAN